MKNKTDLEESIISTIKAICGNEKLDVNFELKDINFNQISQNDFLKQIISLPIISDLKSLNLTRAGADLAAFYHKFHNPQIHFQIKKSSPDLLLNFDQEKLFDDFEKFRLIKQGCSEFKGAAINLDQTLSQAWQEILDKNQPVFGLPFLLLWEDFKKNQDAKFSNNKPFYQLRQKIADYMANLKEANLGFGFNLIEQIEQLSNLSFNQQAFANKAWQLIELLGENKKLNQEPKNQQKQQPKNNSPEDNFLQENQQNNQENVEQETTVKPFETKPQSIATQEEQKQAKIFEVSMENFLSSKTIDILQENSQQIKFVNAYKIFTKKFDQIIRANDLATNEELENLRLQLDLKSKKLGNISKKITNKLKRKILSKKQIFSQFNQEEGLIDRKKISQIITKPLSKNYYLTNKEDDYQNTVLTILLDNSGSMRGAPIAISAMAAEIVAKIFEGFAIKTEILGFTTCDWRGGKSKKLWETTGKIKNPGRLSDLRHIVYKAHYQSFKKSKNNLGLMLKDGILKENIDGEALIWAATRLKTATEKRKILLVISDGTPVDDSTNSNNEGDILSNHLHQTIHRLEKHSKIEIAAIGIGHNVGDFYHNSIMVKNIEELGDIMIERICEII